MSEDNIKLARIQLGKFFKERRVEMRHEQSVLAAFMGISVAFLDDIESGKISWGIDLHLRLLQALEVKPYFHATKDPLIEDYSIRQIQDPERYHGFYLADNPLLWPGELAIVKLSDPRLFIRFLYEDTIYSDYEEWILNQTDLQWLDPQDRPLEPELINSVLIDCWNFLSLVERKEDSGET